MRDIIAMSGLPLLVDADVLRLPPGITCATTRSEMSGRTFALPGSGLCADDAPYRLPYESVTLHVGDGGTPRDDPVMTRSEIFGP